MITPSYVPQVNVYQNKSLTTFVKLMRYFLDYLINLTLVVKMTVMVKNMDDFSRVNEVYKEFFSPPYPARSCFEVAKLPRNMNVEVEGIAML